MIHRKQLATTGVLTVAAAGLVSLGLALSGGHASDSKQDTVPAGQVEQVAPTSTPATTTAPVQVPQGGPAAGDNGPVNAPAEVPADEVPPPGVPYDSDGGVVVPNPPNMGPGEVAPPPPTQDSPEQLPPAGQPTVPEEAPGS